MSRGQLPFRDFGTPLGGMYWVIPALFFKLFGPKMITLVKAQVFINILSGLSFRWILKSLDVQSGIRFVSVLLFCLSYSFFNFWPWYNHTVIVYELIALGFLFHYFRHPDGRYRWAGLAISAFFMCCSILTKQDGGGMATLIGCALLIYYTLREKKGIWPLSVFLGTMVVLMGLVMISFGRSGFFYWFNHGQPPHTARVDIRDVVMDLFRSSMWIKWYLFLIAVLLVLRFRDWKELWKNNALTLFLLLTLAIMGEAIIFQVTSYTPPDNNVFFHSFAIAFILTLLSELSLVNFQRPVMTWVCAIGVLLWWSGIYWKYFQRVFDRVFPGNPVAATVSPTGENVVNRNTYMLHPDSTGSIPMDQWVYTGLRSFDKIYMPKPTVEGIHRLMGSDLAKRGSALKVLNMSELTPLAAEMPFDLERNPQLPLWYHLGVAMFNKQAKIFEDRIAQHYYDLVIFEYIPTLNNFYPFRIRDSLKVHYKMTDSFMAPRRGDTEGQIEIYTK